MKWTALILAMLGAVTAHALHARLDPERRARAADLELMVMPDGAALRAAALGYQSFLADLMWVRAVLVYGGLDHVTATPGGDEDEEPDLADEGEPKVAWLGRMVLAVVDLDPGWRTPCFYGATLLRTAGALDDSDAVLLRAMEAFPEDPYFPFALGMNHYIARGDALEAAEWLKRAAELPGAPDWYALAARGLVTRTSGLESSIRYLREEIAATSDPKLVEQLEERLAGLEHDRWVEELEGLRSRVEERLGRPLRSVDELVALGVVEALPADPLGGRWILNADGDVISTVAEDALATKVRRWERGVLTRVLR